MFHPLVLLFRPLLALISRNHYTNTYEWNRLSRLGWEGKQMQAGEVTLHR